MIRFLDGVFMKRTDKGILLMVGGVGYEVEIAASTYRTLGKLEERKTKAELWISYHQSQNQMVPRLYGFGQELQRDFFEELLNVNDLGPSKALTAMSAMPVRKIAKAIVDRDVKILKSLKGIGEKTAEKIIAHLRSRAAIYALLPEDATEVSEQVPDFKAEVREALVKQLQFKPAEAQKAIDEAVTRNSDISSAEELFDEVLRGSK